MSVNLGLTCLWSSGVYLVKNSDGRPHLFVELVHLFFDFLCTVRIGALSFSGWNEIPRAILHRDQAAR